MSNKKIFTQFGTLLILAAFLFISPALSALAVTPPITSQERTLPNFKLVTAYGFEPFVKILNEYGKLGYRLDKTVSYGGEGETQGYAAFLQLDGGSKYEYDWFSNPNKNWLEAQLNTQARKGFYFVSSFALTYCTQGTTEENANPTAPDSLIFRLKKGNVFLFERKNGLTTPVREYKVFNAKVHLGDSAEKNIQSAISEAAQQGFRPVKILFARQGLLDFHLAVMVERNLQAEPSSNAEYRFLKKTSGGLPKEVNALAAQGFRFVTGRRVGTIVMALMVKQGTDATTYTAIDERKFAKEFEPTLARGNYFQGVLFGDLTCGSTEVENEKLIFVQNTKDTPRENKLLSLSLAKNGELAADSLAAFQRFLDDKYSVKEIFYSNGLQVVFEK